MCRVFPCLGMGFLCCTWVPRFFVVLGFVFLVRLLGCLGVLVGDFFVFWRLSGVLFCGGGCFWGGFFYLVDVVLLAFVFFGCRVLGVAVWRVVVGRVFRVCLVFMSMGCFIFCVVLVGCVCFFLHVSMFMCVGWVVFCRVGRLFMGCVCCVLWFGFLVI